MFLIETINHCPKLVTAGHTDYSRLKRVVQGFLSLSCLTQTYCTHFISSFSCHFIAFISLVSHILSDVWHLLFITALVKAEPMVSCAPEWTVRMDCSFSAPQTKDCMNKLWCGVDVEPEPGPPHMSPPMDLRGQLRYINTGERGGESNLTLSTRSTHRRSMDRMW